MKGCRQCSMASTDEAEQQPMADNQNNAQLPDGSDAMVPMDLGTAMSLPPDPNVNQGWIGGPCTSDSECTYAEAFASRMRDTRADTCSQGCDVSVLTWTTCRSPFVRRPHQRTRGMRTTMRYRGISRNPRLPAVIVVKRVSDILNRVSDLVSAYPGTPDPTVPAPVGGTQCTND